MRVIRSRKTHTQKVCHKQMKTIFISIIDSTITPQLITDNAKKNKQTKNNSPSNNYKILIIIIDRKREKQKQKKQNIKDKQQ